MYNLGLLMNGGFAVNADKPDVQPLNVPNNAHIIEPEPVQAAVGLPMPVAATEGAVWKWIMVCVVCVLVGMMLKV